jgi:hypothetical protein
MLEHAYILAGTHTARAAQDLAAKGTGKDGCHEQKRSPWRKLGGGSHQRERKEEREREREREKTSLMWIYVSIQHVTHILTHNTHTRTHGIKPFVLLGAVIYTVLVTKCALNIAERESEEKTEADQKPWRGQTVKKNENKIMMGCTPTTLVLVPWFYFYFRCLFVSVFLFFLFVAVC